ncbi:uncharacterized protein LOC129044009 isoform X1 [Pongo pygmaeus]|uniref:uncharacterized protein LOC129044009 isoform X1 n=1 Tax=Pongo pygmaeus TaxID=9600 RepID=UPI0023E325D6|nr:uncharacterized protein LOC129044009 isoform X1 [Pongo pygmaeus]
MDLGVRGQGPRLWESEAGCYPGVLPPASLRGALGLLWVGLTLLGMVQPQHQGPQRGPNLLFHKICLQPGLRKEQPWSRPTCSAEAGCPEPLPGTHPANAGPGPLSLRSSQIRTSLEARRKWGWKMTRWRLRRDQAPGEGTQAKLLSEALSTAGRGHAGPPEGWAGEGGVSPGLTPPLGTGQGKELDFDLREKFIRFGQILGISLDHIPFLPQTLAPAALGGVGKAAETSLMPGGWPRALQAKAWGQAGVSAEERVPGARMTQPEIHQPLPCPCSLGGRTAQETIGVRRSKPGARGSWQDPGSLEAPHVHSMQRGRQCRRRGCREALVSPHF